MEFGAPSQPSSRHYRADGALLQGTLESQHDEVVVEVGQKDEALGFCTPEFTPRDLYKQRRPLFVVKKLSIPVTPTSLQSLLPRLVEVLLGIRQPVGFRGPLHSDRYSH